MEEFKEIEAMKTIGTALSGLDSEAKLRVLSWAVSKFNIQKLNVGLTVDSKKRETEENNSVEQVAEQINDFDSVPDLYFAANPSTHAERALVIGYWFQEIKSKHEFDSQSVNSELKNLGNPIGNITRAFNQLMRKKPTLVMQTKKTGTTKQARKKFKLTVAGIRKVKKMIEE